MHCRREGARLDRQAEAATAAPGPIQLRAHLRVKKGQACQQQVVMLGRPRHCPATRRQAAGRIHSQQPWECKGQNAHHQIVQVVPPVSKALGGALAHLRAER